MFFGKKHPAAGENKHKNRTYILVSKTVINNGHKMDIGKYTGYFHDGDLSAIIHKGNNIEFLLESSVIDPDEDVDKSILSNSSTLKGSLLLYNIKTIKVGNKEYKGILQKQYDDGEILDLEVENNKVFLLIEWTNFPPKIRATDVSKIEIEAEKVQWIPEKPRMNGKSARHFD